MKYNNELRQKQIYVNYNRHFQTSKTISVNMAGLVLCFINLNKAETATDR